MLNGPAVMSINDYEEIYKMWCGMPGLCVSCADSKESIARYIDRNPGLSFVYYKDNKIIGTILCGHDGRRGYIHHTCVLPEYQSRGIGKELVEKSLNELRKQGIEKCHLFVLADNEAGKVFWEKLGWEKRLEVYSKFL